MAKRYVIDGVVIETVRPESCYRLDQFFRRQPITCRCNRCAAKNQTPEEALKAVRIAHGLAA